LQDCCLSTHPKNGFVRSESTMTSGNMAPGWRPSMSSRIRNSWQNERTLSVSSLFLVSSIICQNSEWVKWQQRQQTFGSKHLSQKSGGISEVSTLTWSMTCPGIRTDQTQINYLPWQSTGGSQELHELERLPVEILDPTLQCSRVVGEGQCHSSGQRNAE
jgi:hypothetical protein